MSANNSRGAEGRRKTDRAKLFTRIFALFLAVLMVLGTIFYTIYFLVNDVAALEPSSTNDPLLTIGLIYGEDSEASYEVSSTDGFVLGSTVIERETRTFNEVWRLRETNICAVIDYNLTKYGGAYYKATEGTYAVGMYHIEAGGTLWSRADAERVLNAASGMSGGYSVFPGYINGTYRVYIGDFSTLEKAESALAGLTALRSSYATRIVGTANTTVSLVEPSSNRVLFEYDCGTASYLGCEAIQTGYETAYIKSAANLLYPGVLVFRRYQSAYTDGIEVINLLHLETYITGVLPWEISNSWGFEVQRVFAIAARTFAIGNLHRHFNGDGFDICCNQHCQAYRGCSRTNENVLAASSTTRGQVIAFEGETALICYASSCGGETVTAQAAWGGGANLTYLKSIKTPWEQYSDYENGVWVDEVDPYTLAQYLYNKGYYQLTSGYISSITVNSRFGDTGYIYSITFTDSWGNSATVTTTDAVRTALSRYVCSANFTIGRGSLEYSYDVVTNIQLSIGGVAAVPTGPAYPELFDQLPLQQNVTVMTADGIVSGLNKTLVAITTYGRRAITTDSASVLTAGGYAKLQTMIANGTLPAPSFDSATIDIENPGALTPTDLYVDATTSKVTKTYYAASNENYIFAGKGFGHGVGLSQYGALDLANAGVPAELIISTYFPGTEIVDMKTIHGY